MSARRVTMNLFLLAIGSAVIVLGMNGILIPHRFLNGGVSGIALIVHYWIPSVGVGPLYLLFNIPFFALAWFQVSHKFMAYTGFGVLVFSLLAEVIKIPPFPVKDPILAAILAGIICGIGAGLIFRSAGSSGGVDILAVYLNKRFDFRLGWTFSMTNALILLMAAFFFNLEMALYTAIFVFTQGRLIDAIITGFNKRKTIMVISDQSREIADAIMNKLNRGVTFLDGSGAYTETPKKVIFSVVAMTELPRIKDLIFGLDPHAFVVINDTLDVLGYRHGERRVW